MSSRIPVSARLFLLLLGSWTAGASPARAEEPPGLREFAETVWDAIRSGDPKQVQALYHPRSLEPMTPDEKAFLEKGQRELCEAIDLDPGDSHTVRVYAESEAPEFYRFSPEFTWPVPPKFQIHIQTYKHTDTGKKKHKLIVEAATQLEGRFWLVSARIPPEVLDQERRRSRGRENPDAVVPPLPKKKSPNPKKYY